MHSVKISVYCERYLRDAPVVRNKYVQDLWSNLVSNLCRKFKGHSLSNGCRIFIYGKISCSCGMCRSVRWWYGTHDRMYVLSFTCNSPDRAAVVSKDSCLDILGGEIYACSEVLVVYGMSYSVAVHINNKVMMFINVNHNARTFALP